MLEFIYPDMPMYGSHGMQSLLSDKTKGSSSNQNNPVRMTDCQVIEIKCSYVLVVIKHQHTVIL